MCVEPWMILCRPSPSSKPSMPVGTLVLPIPQGTTTRLPELVIGGRERKLQSPRLIVVVDATPRQSLVPFKLRLPLTNKVKWPSD